MSVEPSTPQTTRPRPGNLEAAATRHTSVPSGEYVGRTRVEICDLCGMTRNNWLIHTDITQDPI